MSKFTERIRLVFDVDTVNSKKGFSQFGKDIREAEGLTGKMKAGVGSLSTMLKDNMGAAAIAGGAALVAFGVKAVGAFTDTAKAAIDMSKATGLSVEEASRLIAVGDDLGVSAEGLTAGLGKIAKTLDGTQWAKYGIATKDAGGNTRSTNDIFLDALETLGKISNETDRAAAGNELFGKGYANLAPIVGKTRAEMEDYLASVEDGQVITKEEAKKAEKMRLAMDTLSDSLGELALSFGAVAAEAAPLINVLSRVTTGLGRVIEGTKDAAGKIVDGASKVVDFLNPWSEEQDKVAASAEEMAAATLESADAVDELGDAAADAVRPVADLLDELSSAWDAESDAGRAWDTYISALEDLATAADDPTTMVNEFNEAVRDTADDARAAAAALAEKARQDAIANGEQWDATDSAKAQREALELMVGSLAEGSPLRAALQGYIDDLNAIPGVKTTTVRIDGVRVPASSTDPSQPMGYGVMAPGWTMGPNGAPVKAPPSFGGGVLAPGWEMGAGGTPVPKGVGAGYASGTSSATPGVHLVGENGPELVNFRGGESVTPAGPTARALAGGGDTYNITVNAMVADADAGRRIASALEAHKRNGGKLPS